MDTPQNAVVKAEKPPMSIGARGIQFGTLDELWRFAQYITKSGFAPKGMDSAEAIVVAMEMGLEIGLSPMASIQNIAVINGRPAVWGDVPLAIARNTGQLEVFEEWYEENGKRLDRSPSILNDTTTAVCRIKRTGYVPSTTTFSIADAKRAALFGKAGPWSQYPQRMLQMRARGFALRDQFGDALKGLITKEEAEDIDPVQKAKNITPSQPLATTVQIENLKVEREADEIPMTFPASTGNASASLPASPASEPKGQSVPPSVNHHAALERIVYGQNVTFDAFQKWAIEMGELTVEVGTWTDLPASFAEKWATREKALIRAIAPVKGAAK